MKTSPIFYSGIAGTFVCALMMASSLCFGQSAATGAPTQEKSQQSAATPQETSDNTTTEESAATTDDAEPFQVKVAEDNMLFMATGAWKSVPPRSRMLEAEIKIPKVGDDPEDGRLTIMGAGGSIEANIDRWKGQFTQPDGSDTSDKAKVVEKTIADQRVHLVDIVGTYLDSPGGPMGGAPKVEKANYRMLAAIIETEKNGNYFVKFYGPKATVDQNAAAFKAMIESLKIAE